MKISYILSVLAGVMSAAPAIAGGDLIPSTGFAHIDEDSEAFLGLEYRHDPVYYSLRPTAGIMVDAESAIYGYAGAYYEIALSDNWFLSPGFAVGLYEDGDSLDLGGTVEFRSALEVSYQLETVRVGLGIQHISNAGIYDDNPGTEVVGVNVQIPMNW